MLFKCTTPTQFPAISVTGATLAPPLPDYQLPILSVAGSPAYAVVAVMQKGRVLRRTATGWAVLAAKPADVVRPTDETVADMLARHLIVPAPGSKWDNPRECYLSAIGWRAVGCMYTDQTAAIELRVYELAGTDRDNDVARKYRSTTAEWRARVARRETTPAWDHKLNEFFLTVPDKVSGDGVKTVTVIFESGRPSAPDHFEFFGDVNAKGYHHHTQGQGETLRATVSQRAFELACELCAAYAEEKRSIAAHTPKPKPVLRILDEGDDAEALARELGLL
jgi:hypothetical protein